MARVSVSVLSVTFLCTELPNRPAEPRPGSELPLGQVGPYVCVRVCSCAYACWFLCMCLCVSVYACVYTCVSYALTCLCIHVPCACLCVDMTGCADMCLYVHVCAHVCAGIGGHVTEGGGPHCTLGDGQDANGMLSSPHALGHKPHMGRASRETL